MTLEHLLAIARRDARLAGLGGVTGIDVWDTTGSIVQDLNHPIVLSMAKEVSHGQRYGSNFPNNNQLCRVSGNGILKRAQA